MSLSKYQKSLVVLWNLQKVVIIRLDYILDKKDFFKNIDKNNINIFLKRYNPFFGNIIFYIII